MGAHHSALWLRAPCGALFSPQPCDWIQRGHSGGGGGGGIVEDRDETAAVAAITYRCNIKSRAHIQKNNENLLYPEVSEQLCYHLYLMTNEPSPETGGG